MNTSFYPCLTSFERKQQKTSSPISFPSSATHFCGCVISDWISICTVRVSGTFPFRLSFIPFLRSFATEDSRITREYVIRAPNWYQRIVTFANSLWRKLRSLFFNRSQKKLKEKKRTQEKEGRKMCQRKGKVRLIISIRHFFIGLLSSWMVLFLASWNFVENAPHRYKTKVIQILK